MADAPVSFEEMLEALKDAQAVLESEGPAMAYIEASRDLQLARQRVLDAIKVLRSYYERPAYMDDPRFRRGHNA